MSKIYCLVQDYMYGVYNMDETLTLIADAVDGLDYEEGDRFFQYILKWKEAE